MVKRSDFPSSLLSFWKTALQGSCAQVWGHLSISGPAQACRRYWGQALHWICDHSCSWYWRFKGQPYQVVPQMCIGLWLKDLKAACIILSFHKRCPATTENTAPFIFIYLQLFYLAFLLKETKGTLSPPKIRIKKTKKPLKNQLHYLLKVHKTLKQY